MANEKLNRCCDQKPFIIGDGIKPSYGTVIHCLDYEDCGRRVFVSNDKGTGGTRLPAIKKWNETF